MVRTFAVTLLLSGGAPGIAASEDPAPPAKEQPAVAPKDALEPGRSLIAQVYTLDGSDFFRAVVRGPDGGTLSEGPSVRLTEDKPLGAHLAALPAPYVLEDTRRGPNPEEAEPAQEGPMAEEHRRQKAEREARRRIIDAAQGIANSLQNLLPAVIGIPLRVQPPPALPPQPPPPPNNEIYVSAEPGQGPG